MKKYIPASIMICLCVQNTSAQKSVELYSPDKSIHYRCTQSGNNLQYDVWYKGNSIISSSPLSVKFSGDDYKGIKPAGKPVYRNGEESYELYVGKTNKVKEPYREVEIPFLQEGNKSKRVNLVVRVFNDGIAFRYRFLASPNDSMLLLTGEHSTFRFTGNPLVRTLLLPSYTSSHEGYYTTVPLNSLTEDTLMDMPTLFEFPGPVFVGITEASLLNFAGMYLVKHKGNIESRLSPLPGQSPLKVRAGLPHQSPWRVMMISNRIGALIESNLITNLAEPCRIKDPSWIKPGKSTFPWWNGNVVPDTINAPGNNFVTNQYYIDFCARNQLEYHSVVEYGLHQWYTDDGVGFAPGPHADVTTPVPGLDMKEICDYAATKGVGVRVWVHWAALYPKLDSAFAIFEKWGLKGMMVDFMDRDDQEMVNIQTEILEKAAKHHLHIQFHGAYKPTGLHRTYPNELTREGTLNYETNKWGPPLPPEHDIMMPFTRMLAGATDYHLGGFRAVAANKYRAQYTRPLMAGTRCHMLAMYVVLESYLAMVCDYPEAYEGQPGFEFIREVPTTWDETKVIDAKAGEYIIIARRKNKDWFLGAITNDKARNVKCSLDFLENGTYDATRFTDAGDAFQNPDHLNINKAIVSAKEPLTMSLAAGGGAALIFRAK